MKVTIYKKPGCGPCGATRHAMDSRGIAHEVIDVMDDDAALDQHILHQAKAQGTAKNAATPHGR